MKEQQIVANLNQWQVEVIWEEQTASHNLLQKHAKLYVTDVIFLLVSSMSLVIPYGPMCLDS